MMSSANLELHLVRDQGESVGAAAAADGVMQAVDDHVRGGVVKDEVTAQEPVIDVRRQRR